MRPAAYLQAGPCFSSPLHPPERSEGKIENTKQPKDTKTNPLTGEGRGTPPNPPYSDFIAPYSTKHNAPNKTPFRFWKAFQQSMQSQENTKCILHTWT